MKYFGRIRAYIIEDVAFQATARFRDLGAFFLRDYVKLNNIYRTGNPGVSSVTYCKVTNDNQKVQISFRFEDVAGKITYSEYLIHFDSNSQWTAFESKYFSEEQVVYTYLKKATNENRIFDRYLQISKSQNTITAIEIDETTQKMLYVDEFTTNNMEAVDTKVYNYFYSLNVSNIVNNIDVESAIVIQ